MKAIKLSTLTKEQISELKIFPIDVEAFTEENINSSYNDLLLLNIYEAKQGTLIRQWDDVLFRLCCRDTEDGQVKSKNWLEVDGYFYRVDEVIEKLINADYEVENDL